MSLKFILLSSLSILSFVCASPVHAAGAVTSRSTIRPRQLRPYYKSAHRRSNETEAVASIGASITVDETAVDIAKAGDYPRFLRLSDGSILAATSRTENGTQMIAITKSTNNGTSFSEFGTVAKGGDDMSNAVLLQLDSGKILCAYRNHDKNAAGDYTYYRITVSSSDNGGATWDFLSQAAEQAATATKNGLWEPFMRLGAKGDVQVTYSGELAADNQETFRVTSTTDGKDWTSPTNLHLHSTSDNWRDGMQSILPFKDSNGTDALVMVLESLQTDHFLIDSVVSAGSPQVAKIGDDIAVIFGTDKDSGSHSGEWQFAAASVMIFSEGLATGKLSWSKELITIGETPSFWPGVLEMGSDSVLAACGRDGVPQGKMVYHTTG
ncbi:Uu.00g050860.m01.CDS01 [Anthostomella pinea]|uniref:Uu.00g050860.m01.CDS01 n=1 Tax=Anthostomella pinea TaxID=933095 RepID=A0AAI8YMJ9_9PEZI|nr:Uu.00g050860.m01.CDS01 [Anthostomella pinea]